MAGEHQSAREKLLSAARLEEEDERLQKLRRLEKKRVASCKSSDGADTEVDIQERKRKRMEEMEDLELKAHSAKSWLKGEFRQALADGDNMESERESKKRQELARQIADEEATFRAERKVKKTDAETMRHSVIVAEQRKLQEKAADRTSRRPNILVKNDGDKIASVSPDVDARRSSPENVDTTDEAVVVVPTDTTLHDEQAMGGRNLTLLCAPAVESQNDGVGGVVTSAATSTFRRELWPELCGDGKQEPKSSGILGGYDSDSSESGESA